MRTPMPSPRGTNRAQLFINTNPSAAYDEATTEWDGVAAFLCERLSPEDFEEFCRMIKAGEQPAMDGRYRASKLRRAEMMAVPRRPAAFDERSFAQRYPHAAKIKVSP